MTQPSPWRSVARLIAKRVRERGGENASRAAPRRKPAVEAADIAAHPKRLAAYLAATNGAHIAAFATSGGVLPPIFPATWETVLFVDLFASLDVPMPRGGALHLQSERLPLRPLRVADRIRCRVELDRTEQDERGTCLTLAARNWNAAGHLCSQSTATFLLRSEQPARSRTRTARTESPHAGSTDPECRPDRWREVAHWQLRANHGRRYARASGDYNPIHLWTWTARPLGFARPILHGYCTEALVAHALVEHLFSGDPAALRRLHTTFRLPVALPADLRLLTGKADAQSWFRVVCADAADRVHAEGTFAGG